MIVLVSRTKKSRNPSQPTNKQADTTRRALGNVIADGSVPRGHPAGSLHSPAGLEGVMLLLFQNDAKTLRQRAVNCEHAVEIDTTVLVRLAHQLRFDEIENDLAKIVGAMDA